MDTLNMKSHSLHACRAARDQHVNDTSQVPNNDKSNQVEATQIGPPVIDQLWQSFQEAYTNASTTFGKRASDILDQGNELSQDNNQDQYTNLVQQVHSLMSPQPSIHLPPAATAQPPQHATANDSQCQSSSGFTSFFTTTDAKNSGTNSGGSSESYTSRDKKVNTACHVDTKEGDNHSDTSSLVVLARVKRKHLSSNSDDSKKSSSGDNKAVEEGTASTKRVCIETVSVAGNQGSQASSSLTQSLGSSTDAAVATKTVPLSQTTKRLVTTDATTATTGTSKSESSPMNVDNPKIKPVENQHVAVDHPKTTEKRLSISSNIDTMASKEELIEKKRRHRMNMRREYENERRDSSSSSDPQDSSTLLPAGKPITLEEVLSFTKTARLLVQALPPFLAVHSNAAFTSLCGIESSAVIGVGVASIISLPNDISKATTSKEGDSSSNSDNVNKDAMSSLSGGTVSDPVVANDAIVQRDDVEVPTEDTNIRPLKIDRLIVTRGYGHVHNVNVACAVPNNFKDVFNEEEQNKIEIPIIRCRMSVCPVLSSGPDANPNNHKRQKTDGNSVKHYLIQLESVDSTRTLMSGSSFASSDTTEQAQALGLTRTDVKARRCMNQEKTNSRAEQESQGSSASVLDAIATCG